jgi:hypothetical protein
MSGFDHGCRRDAEKTFTEVTIRSVTTSSPYLRIEALRVREKNKFATLSVAALGRQDAGISVYSEFPHQQPEEMHRHRRSKSDVIFE